MTGKLYSLEEIDAYIDRKPSPEYDISIRFDEKLGAWAKRCIDISSTDLMDFMWLFAELKAIDDYDGIDNERKTLTEASSEFFDRLHQACVPMAGETQWSLRSMVRMILDYDMTDIHDFISPLSFITPEVYAGVVLMWDDMRDIFSEMWDDSEREIIDEVKEER